MDRKKKTASELVALIRAFEPQLKDAQFNVHKERINSWSATLNAGPSTELEIALKQSVDALRALYDLKD